MKRSQGYKAIELDENTIIDENRCAERGSAMDDAMSGGDEPTLAAMALDPGEKLGEKRLVPEGGVGRPPVLGQSTPGRIDGPEMRGCAYSLDLSFADQW